ncbi:MAG: ABC transporter substrate-binding protein [Opitutales bacterium]|nr:ABC transporter substrate-binding protein [Opitutales bacterium]
MIFLPMLLIKRVIPFCAFLLLLISLKAQEETLSPLTFTPQWLPQAQFAGFYMAQEKGFYRDAGLEVSIVHPSASVMATEQLKRGEADVISLFLVTALSKRSVDFPLVNIAQLSQNSGLLFVAKKSAGIHSLEDFNGRRVGIWKSGFDEIPKSLFRENNYEIQWVPLLSSINMFLAGGIDAMTVMSYNEYDQIINAGINPDALSVFACSDYGYNIPEDGLYCLQSTLQNRQEDLQRFVRATEKGWAYADTHREETLSVVLRIMTDAHVATNYAHQKWMLEKVLELHQPGSKHVSSGELAEPDFYKTLRLLLEGGYISEKISFQEFHRNLMQDQEVK